MTQPPYRSRARRPARRTVSSLLLTVASLAALAACGDSSDADRATTSPEPAATGTATTDLDTTAAAPVTGQTSRPDEPSTTSGSPDTTPTTAAPNVEEYTFTDDRGETITFDERPTRVVAWQAMVPALVELGIEPVGVIAFNDLATNPAFIEAGVDVATLTPVSTSYGEVDLEALAALDPDLILTYTFGGDFLQGFTDGDTESLAGEVAPFVALDSNAPVMAGIERMEELGVLLGADLTSDRHLAAVAAFDTAVTDLQTLIGEKPGLSAAFGGPSPNGLFLAPADDYPELQFYQELGLEVFSGTQDSVVSWELTEGIAADVFLIDDRSTQADLDEAANIATWMSIPAVAAGQYSATWRFLLSYSRADYARTIQRMLPTLDAADPGVA